MFTFLNFTFSFSVNFKSILLRLLALGKNKNKFGNNHRNDYNNKLNNYETLQKNYKYSRLPKEEKGRFKNQITTINSIHHSVASTTISKLLARNDLRKGSGDEFKLGL